MLPFRASDFRRGSAVIETPARELILCKVGETITAQRLNRFYAYPCADNAGR